MNRNFYSVLSKLQYKYNIPDDILCHIFFFLNKYVRTMISFDNAVSKVTLSFRVLL